MIALSSVQWLVMIGRLLLLCLLGATGKLVSPPLPTAVACTAGCAEVWSEQHGGSGCWVWESRGSERQLLPPHNALNPPAALFPPEPCPKLWMPAPPPALPQSWAQAEGGCIMAGQQVIGSCEDERNVIAAGFPLSTTETVAAEQIDAAAAALKARQGLPAQE